MSKRHKSNNQKYDDLVIEYHKALNKIIWQEKQLNQFRSALKKTTEFKIQDGNFKLEPTTLKECLELRKSINCSQCSKSNDDSCYNIEYRENLKC